MVSFFRAVNGLLPFISRLCLVLCSIAMVVLLVIFGWLVFGRYVLNQTPTWVEQLALLLVCYITFIGAAVGVHEQNHLGVTFIRESFPKFIKRPMRIVCDVALCVFGGFMLVYGIDLVQFGWSTNLAMLNIPEGIRTLAAAICGGLICLFGGAHAISKTYTYYLSDDRAGDEDVF
ncbi:MAG: TRAP transporter small permease [Ahrensia sp.]